MCEQTELQEIELAYLERQQLCENALQEAFDKGVSPESMAILEFETGLRTPKKQQVA